MQFTYAAIAAVLASSVSATYYGYTNATASPVYVTDVVTAYTTYCPYATEVTMGGKTYTVTEATTLTITDCPCTVSKPVYVTPVVSVAPVYMNSTGVVVAPTAGYAAATTATAVAPSYTGAASKAVAGAGGLAAAAMIAILAL